MFIFREPGSRESGAAQPSLALAQSFWALGERAVGREAALEAACAQGYRYLEAGLSAERMPVLRDLRSRLPLQLIAQGWATRAADADDFLQRAAELRAVCINFHLGHAFLGVAEAVALIGEVEHKCARYGLPMLLETHRGRITQDLLRTVEIVRQLPSLRLVLDASHYFVAGEGTGGDAARQAALLRTLSARAAMIHGRFSDGQSIQVRTADPMALTTATTRLWTHSMASWLRTAPADAVFVFEPELGPPPYAARDREGSELWDRTAETETLVQCADAAWRAALSAVATPAELLEGAAL